MAQSIVHEHVIKGKMGILPEEAWCGETETTIYAHFFRRSDDLKIFYTTLLLV